MRELFLILLLLACPLMMLVMHRGHGHGSHARGAVGDDTSTRDLRRRRDELDRMISERESAQAVPVAEGARLAPPDPAVVNGSRPALRKARR